MKTIALLVIVLILASGCITQDAARQRLEDKMSQVGEEVEEATREAVSNMAKKINIEHAASGAIVVRNIGSSTINATELTIHIDGVQQDCSWDKPRVEADDRIVADCICTRDQVIEIEAPGNTDIVECY